MKDLQPYQKKMLKSIRFGMGYGMGTTSISHVQQMLPRTMIVSQAIHDSFVVTDYGDMEARVMAKENLPKTWTTANGRVLKIKEMTTDHLCNVLKHIEKRVSGMEGVRVHEVPAYIAVKRELDAREILGSLGT